MFGYLVYIREFVFWCVEGFWDCKIFVIVISGIYMVVIIELGFFICFFFLLYICKLFIYIYVILRKLVDVVIVVIIIVIDFFYVIISFFLNLDGVYICLIFD